MRQGLSAILLAISPCLVATPTLAEELPTSVIAIDDQLFTKHSELSNAKAELDKQQELVDDQQRQLKTLAKQAKSFDTEMTKAKADLERDYQRMIDEPSIDIVASQQAYQDAWAKVKQNQKYRLEAEQELEELSANLFSKQTTVEHIKKSINELDIAKLRARAERMKEELQQSQTLNVSFTNRCQSSMTLAQCDSQTKELALQKAVKQFQNALIDSTTESSLAKQHIDQVSLNTHVLRHSVVEQGFYDGERYRNILDVQLEARPSESAACKLLGIKNTYCFAPGYEAAQQSSEQEVAWVSLSLRSNQYGDKVIVDGVSYGSTPVEVLLPVGLHNIVIKKDGYHSYQKELRITSNYSLRANLVEKKNILSAGDKFADSMRGGRQAPEVIALLPGEYLVGEHASNQIFLDHAFGIGATPVTVNQFESFVNQTNYQSDAELKNTCTTIKDGEITPISGSYWRNPGFKQYENSPVVCVSRNDAKAYINWLTKQTGFKYRLPTEDEWEIAARSGSHNQYWWGDKFEAGRANTGWSGTPWSNKSTSPVSAFKPNKLGIYDAIGNVWQWTSDSRGIAKGGAWNSAPEMAAAHQQLFLSPSSTSNYVGFRIVREIN
ncbi:SUMF1/EgtB/PvdO family nonheme iron enzyme [Vibrio sp. NTOU-M3]|uniref:SUMF1/EgtB/PvdO family nonheme iron enzyme n=1 Tax=Vibrio sp. NTOU-M3 TaxID=3234954 RepID=UPI00349FA3BD